MLATSLRRAAIQAVIVKNTRLANRGFGAIAISGDLPIILCCCKLKTTSTNIELVAPAACKLTLTGG